MKKIGFNNGKNEKNDKSKFYDNVNRLTVGHSPTYYGNYAVECQKNAKDDHQGRRRFRVSTINEDGTHRILKGNVTMKRLREIIG